MCPSALTVSEASQTLLQMLVRSGPYRPMEFMMKKNKLKPRNPFVALAKFRNAGQHAKPTKSLRRQEKQVLAKTVKQPPESWQQRLSVEGGFAMTSVNPVFALPGLLQLGPLVSGSVSRSRSRGFHSEEPQARIKVG